MPEPLQSLRISDLRLIESSLEVRIECFKRFLSQEPDNNITWLTLAPAGMKISHKIDYVTQEIKRTEILLERVRLAILNF